MGANKYSRWEFFSAIGHPPDGSKMVMALALAKVRVEPL